jgi:hypothetical protein
MDISLSSAAPLVDTANLIAGAAYGIAHIGGIKASVQVGASAAWQVIYSAPHGGGGYLPALCGTSIRWELDGSTATAEITLTAAL